MEKLTAFIKSLAIRIHPSGLMVVLGVAIGCLFIASIFDGFGFIGFLLTGIVLLYYRNPKRTSPQREGLILSPIDGTIKDITTETPPEEMGLGEDEMIRIQIMSSLLGVHVARAPVIGKVAHINEIAGAHGMADTAHAAETNHREVIRFEAENGAACGILKVCGPLDIPVEQSLDEGHGVHAGEHIGLIRPLSRVDIFIPATTSAFALKGQHVVAGESILADLKSHEPQRDAVTE